MKWNQNILNIYKFMHKLMSISLRVLCAVAPRAAAHFADKLFFIPMGLPRPESEMPYYDSAIHSSIDFMGNKIAIYSWGEGEKSVLLVHGWASRGTRLGHLAEPLNKKGYRVISFDMTAHGDSEGKTTNLFEGSELIARIYEQYRPIVAIIGHSFGGMALSNAIYRHNLKIERAVIVASPFTMNYIIESFRELINITAKVNDMMVTRIQKRFKESSDLNIFDLSVDSFAADLKMPFLVIHDKDDKDVPYSQGEGYANNLPNAEFVTTTGLGHRRVLKDPEIITKIVEFISTSVSP